MGVLSCNANVDGITVMKLVIFIKGSEVENPVKNIVVGVLAEHAEVDLRNHHCERMHIMQAFN